jgi:hypothetical protein
MATHEIGRLHIYNNSPDMAAYASTHEIAGPHTMHATQELRVTYTPKHLPADYIDNLTAKIVAEETQESQAINPAPWTQRYWVPENTAVWNTQLETFITPTPGQQLIVPGGDVEYASKIAHKALLSINQKARKQIRQAELNEVITEVVPVITYVQDAKDPSRYRYHSMEKEITGTHREIRNHMRDVAKELEYFRTRKIQCTTELTKTSSNTGSRTFLPTDDDFEQCLGSIYCRLTGKLAVPGQRVERGDLYASKMAARTAKARATRILNRNINRDVANFRKMACRTVDAKYITNVDAAHETNTVIYEHADDDTITVGSQCARNVNLGYEHILRPNVEAQTAHSVYIANDVNGENHGYHTHIDSRPYWGLMRTIQTTIPGVFRTVRLTSQFYGNEMINGKIADIVQLTSDYRYILAPFGQPTDLSRGVVSTVDYHQHQQNMGWRSAALFPVYYPAEHEHTVSNGSGEYLYNFEMMHRAAMARRRPIATVMPKPANYPTAWPQPLPGSVTTVETVVPTRENILRLTDVLPTVIPAVTSLKLDLLTADRLPNIAAPEIDRWVFMPTSAEQVSEFYESMVIDREGANLYIGADVTKEDADKLAGSLDYARISNIAAVIMDIEIETRGVPTHQGRILTPKIPKYPALSCSTRNTDLARFKRNQYGYDEYESYDETVGNHEGKLHHLRRAFPVTANTISELPVIQNVITQLAELPIEKVTLLEDYGGNFRLHMNGFQRHLGAETNISDYDDSYGFEIVDIPKIIVPHRNDPILDTLDAVSNCVWCGTGHHPGHPHTYYPQNRTLLGVGNEMSNERPRAFVGVGNSTCEWLSPHVGTMKASSYVKQDIKGPIPVKLESWSHQKYLIITPVIETACRKVTASPKTTSDAMRKSDRLSMNEFSGTDQPAEDDDVCDRVGPKTSDFFIRGVCQILDPDLENEEIEEIEEITINEDQKLCIVDIASVEINNIEEVLAITEYLPIEKVEGPLPWKTLRYYINHWFFGNLHTINFNLLPIYVWAFRDSTCLEEVEKYLPFGDTLLQMFIAGKIPNVLYAGKKSKSIVCGEIFDMPTGPSRNVIAAYELHQACLANPEDYNLVEDGPGTPEFEHFLYQHHTFICKKREECDYMKDTIFDQCMQGTYPHFLNKLTAMNFNNLSNDKFISDVLFLSNLSEKIRNILTKYTQILHDKGDITPTNYLELHELGINSLYDNLVDHWCDRGPTMEINCNGEKFEINPHWGFESINDYMQYTPTTDYYASSILIRTLVEETTGLFSEALYCSTEQMKNITFAEPEDIVVTEPEDIAIEQTYNTGVINTIMSKVTKKTQ